MTRQQAKEKGRQVAKDVQVGDFVAFQSRGDPIDDYCMGIAIDAKHGMGPVIKKFESSGKLEGTRFDKGDWAIAVQWLDRLDGDVERRTFTHTENGSTEQSVINSTELRAHGAGLLDKVNPVGKPVRKIGPARCKNKYKDKAPPVEATYVLPADSERAILQSLW